MGINKDQVERRVKELGGKIQEGMGKMTGNRSRHVKGTFDKVAGAGQAKVGDIAEKLKDASRKQ